MSGDLLDADTALTSPVRIVACDSKIRRGPRPLSCGSTGDVGLFEQPEDLVEGVRGDVSARTITQPRTSTDSHRRQGVGHPSCGLRHVASCPTITPVAGISAFGFGITLTPEELASLADRFRRDPIYGGPCLIVNRHSGLALDAKTDASVGGHTTLWTAHAAPWQQWRIRKAGRANVEIVSEPSRLRLTTMRAAGNWTEVWLHNKPQPDWSTEWRLKPTDDRVAFVIENGTSAHALDPGHDATEHHSGDPHLWATHWEPWQRG